MCLFKKLRMCQTLHLCNFVKTKMQNDTALSVSSKSFAPSKTLHLWNFRHWVHLVVLAELDHLGHDVATHVRQGDFLDIVLARPCRVVRAKPRRATGTISLDLSSLAGNIWRLAAAVYRA